MTKRAIITGVTGQDGHYLAEFLVGKGYDVHGTTRAIRKPAAKDDRRTGDDPITLHELDTTDHDAVDRLIREIEPHEIYNLAGQSHVGRSFEIPLETHAANATAALSLLETVRQLATEGQSIRLYQAASSEIFGNPASFPQTEETRLHPRSPYGSSKAYAYHQVVNYREAYDLFAANGILFNHESPRRPEAYVTRKITLAAARIAAGQQHTLPLGNLDVGRDWGYAKEYVRAMWLMMQTDEPSDFIVATNRWHSLEQFLDVAFSHVGLEWRDHVRQDPGLVRPTEVSRLQGDFTRAKELLGWQPETSFEQLVRLMVDADVHRVQEHSFATA